MSSSNYKVNKLELFTMFYGGFVGDALGFPFESSTYGYSVTDYHGKLEYRPVIMKKTGKRYGVIGQVSDDSEMTLALLRSIVENKGKYSRDKAVLAYVDVVNTRSPGIGKNIKKLFTGIKNVKEFDKRYKTHFNPKNGIDPRKAQSNGSLMRCAPLALVPGNNYRNIIVDTDLTNPNDINREASIIYIKLLRGLLFDKKDYIETLNTSKIPEIQKAILQAQNKEIRVIDSSNKGWVVHTLYCAVYCLLNFDNYTEAINWIIKMGGDTDTNAAVSGTLMAAKIGYNLLFDPIFETQLEVVLNVNTRKGDLKRPIRYYPQELENLINELGNHNSNIEMYNNNYKNVLGYYNAGYSPCWYLSDKDRNFEFYIIINNSFMEIIGDINENGIYKINHIGIINDILDIKDVLEKIQQNPMELKISSDLELDDIFNGYKFMTKFLQAVYDLAIYEINPYIKFSDYINPIYLKELYGKRFILLNI